MYFSMRILHQKTEGDADAGNAMARSRGAEMEVAVRIIEWKSKKSISSHHHHTLLTYSSDVLILPLDRPFSLSALHSL